MLESQLSRLRGGDGIALDRQVNTCLNRGVEALLKALADPTRAAILDELVQRAGQTLSEIRNRLASNHGINPSRQAVSQHLQMLEAAGLVHSERSGRYKFHYADTGPLRQITARWPAPEAAPPHSAPTTYPDAPRTGGPAPQKGRET